MFAIYRTLHLADDVHSHRAIALASCRDAVFVAGALGHDDHERSRAGEVISRNDTGCLVHTRCRNSVLVQCAQNSAPKFVKGDVVRLLGRKSGFRLREFAVVADAAAYERHSDG